MPTSTGKEARDAHIIAAYLSGKGLRRLEKEYGLSQPAIRKILIKAGVYGYAGEGAKRHAEYIDRIRTVTAETNANMRKRISRKPMRLKLVELRNKSGLDQQQVAANLGISREHYCRIENCKAAPSGEVWERIEALYGLASGDPSIRATGHRKTVKMVYVKPKAAIAPPYYAKIEYREAAPGEKWQDCHAETFVEYAIIYKRWAYVRPDKKKNIRRKHFEIVDTYETRPEEMPEDTAAAIFAVLKQ